MENEINIIVENRLITEKRDMNIYQNATRTAHMIGCNSSVTLPFKSAGQDDFLYITIVGGPGRMEHVSEVRMPSWIDFQFLTDGKLTVVHLDRQTLLKIPPGLPGWELKLTRSSLPVGDSSNRIIIGEEESEP